MKGYFFCKRRVHFICRYISWIQKSTFLGTLRYYIYSFQNNFKSWSPSYWYYNRQLMSIKSFRYVKKSALKCFEFLPYKSKFSLGLHPRPAPLLLVFAAPAPRGLQLIRNCSDRFFPRTAPVWFTYIILHFQFYGHESMQNL